MKVLIVGSEGNMGQRYKMILKYLKVPFSCFDTKLETSLLAASLDCDRAIIATPTEHHTSNIRDVMKYLKGPILCEKPICKDLLELGKLLDECKANGTDLRMVYQYKKVYRDDVLAGPSYYNYFKHGSDGLNWDCIQIIGLARGSVRISENSPFWNCVINGQTLRIQDMDMAYVEYVADWLKSPVLCAGPDEILDAHKKVVALNGNT